VKEKGEEGENIRLSLERTCKLTRIIIKLPQSEQKIQLHNSYENGTTNAHGEDCGGGRWCCGQNMLVSHLHLSFLT